MCILGIVQWNKPETMINNTSLCCRRQERLSRHLVTVFLIMILAGNLNVALTETVEICNGEESRLSCRQNEIIIMTSAEYGRMEVGRCIPKENDFMGCTNDILQLLDGWCSGHRECNIKVPTIDLEKENTDCLEVLKLYLKATYSCMRIDTSCRSDTPNVRITSEGIISSHLTDSKGCGTSRSPWIISASPGQTIQLTLTDFSANRRSSNLISCPFIYGYIQEKAIGINATICGGRDRQMALYTSKTNEVIMHILARNERNNGQFLIKYEVTGCPELSRPSHAWYKREGNDAVVGCESNDKEWHLTCHGNKWIGEVGNCSQPALSSNPVMPRHENLHFTPTVTMTAVAASALVLVVVAIVIGVVYIKKYRIRQETKFLTKTYSTIERNAEVSYRPITIDQSEGSHQMMSYPEHCTCATLQMRDHGKDTTMATSSLEKQSLYSSIKSA
ncbi:hypothetical protein LSH36_839g03012 [Paralvinella palmiformis]|uniref:CUB domain-containing protein n=1 Tax=Paralvinella palmiformis TaxID=53620 RepID=A0AAD9IZH5_9ANNE|nr:hypothetical protein LSH36_839g03012 [Paralvinella palmiformis]